MQQLPVEILEELLSWLSVKDLLRFKSVCKNWNSIISSHHFINLHLKKSISISSSRSRIFLPHDKAFRTVEYSRDPRGGGDRIDFQTLPRPKETIGTFIGTCDGLICYLDIKTMRICVSNPFLGVSKTLDLNVDTRFCTTILFLWFGRESSDDEYKVVLGIKSYDGKSNYSKYHMHLIKPFSDNCSWKSTREVDGRLELIWYFGEGILLHGIVHCLLYDRVTHAGPTVDYVVFTYDLCRESVGEISMPVGPHFLHAEIGVIDGCLSAICNVSRGNSAIYEVWTMKEYEVKESWTKLMNISRGCDYHMSPYWHLKLVGVTANGDLILSCYPKHRLLIYKVAEKKSEIFTSNGHWSARMYVESLVFP
ncbi:hypothetical protein MIMGU_mgv1a024596mg [Erythranthe guttata]|uniref:F-box domain-containing protein n=1 Tax=Erythranthe guttata TaxID=4155 RepID=A0A022QS09_ERYGU|nr:PREDICTED: F-box/kelch-repeat protein At3g23880-like [Erythranthe guttata]EYU31492.1 hypothetical protein MIMGU_mgv1a024596mg [Erythranthe guttata]|eukprot:XP_012844544.1 PREDICTED: F-box/kelch-repeat protein At3g23880-like [Erythranthe guttata]